MIDPSLSSWDNFLPAHGVRQAQGEPVTDAEKEVFGYNTEIYVRGMTFHVQTESSDNAKNPSINTLIYHKGFLMKKIVRSCSDLLDGENREEKLKERVREQHFEFVGRVKRGEFPARGAEG